MNVKLENGNVVVTLPFDEKGVRSASGKSNVHASTRGNQAVVVKNGKKTHNLSIGVNVYSRV